MLLAIVSHQCEAITIIAPFIGTLASHRKIIKSLTNPTSAFAKIRKDVMMEEYGFVQKSLDYEQHSGTKTR